MSFGVQPPSESDALSKWGREAGSNLKSGLKNLGWGYEQLAEALRAEGIKRSATTINRRINRGNFSAAFYLACQSVMLKAAQTTDRQ